MSDARSLAHPMIEPLDYALTPGKAELSGNGLKVYSLIWNAALATMAEGPAIREQRLVLTASSPEEGSITAFLQSRSELIEEPGWLEILPSENKPVDILTVALPELVQAALDAAPTRLEEDGSRSRDPDACAPALALLGAPTTWSSEIVEGVPPQLSYDVLIEQMASNGVGRPSTFAKALQNAVKNKVITDNEGLVTVGERGRQILVALTSIPDADLVTAQFCSDLEVRLEEVELDASKAGSVLAEFSKRALGTSSGLVSWLDELVIEGESLNEAMRRAANALPPADAWSGAVLPFGIDPLRLVARPDQAETARSELDAVLSATDIGRWKALSSRARAIRRVIAVASVDSALDLDGWAVKCSRDIAWRWWVDLGPGEVPLHAQELRAAESEVSRVAEQSAAELVELFARVIKTIA